MISFIVPAHNEEHLLGATLDAIAATARSLDLAFEIIVVDDSSSDRTADIATRHAALVVSVNVRQIAAVRNVGARTARGQMFVFVDADTIVSAAPVAAAVRTIASGAVGGGARALWEGPLPWWARLLAITTDWCLRIGNVAPGCFLFCTRDAFFAAGGFDERLYATEELSLSRALKRHGRFVLLREKVTTSGRKLRTHSGFELVRMARMFARHGFGMLHDRQHLPLWYGERRNEDPSRSNTV